MTECLLSATINRIRGRGGSGGVPTPLLDPPAPPYHHNGASLLGLRPAGRHPWVTGVTGEWATERNGGRRRYSGNFDSFRLSRLSETLTFGPKERKFAARGQRMETRERRRYGVIRNCFIPSTSPSTQTFGAKPGSLPRGDDVGDAGKTDKRTNPNPIRLPASPSTQTFGAE